MQKLATNLKASTAITKTKKTSQIRYDLLHFYFHRVPLISTLMGDLLG
jgi:hypothetical protein